MLANVPAFCLVQNVSNVIAGVAQMFELGDKVLNRLLEEYVVLPKRVIGVDQ